MKLLSKFEKIFWIIKLFDIIKHICEKFAKNFSKS